LRPQAKEGGCDLFVDMDGVLADFDAHHEAVFGVRPSKVTDNVHWAAVRRGRGLL
jgi:hypothetical protein